MSNSTLVLVSTFFPLAIYYGTKVCIEHLNTRRSGESEQSWFARQRDPKTAALVASVLGGLGFMAALLAFL